MSGLETRTVTVNGHAARLWEKGRGKRIGYFAGLAGAPKWTPFLENLSESHRIVVPSLPGFPGAVDYDHLDTTLDWITATLDLIEAADLAGCDLVASSIGAMLALEAAALSPGMLGRLALLAPLGLHDDEAPIPHIWARKSADMAALLCRDTDGLGELQSAAEGEDPVEWNLMIARATAASARLLWPMCELGLAGRLHRVRQPVLLVWGEEDRIVTPGYAERFRSLIGGPGEITLVPRAGHLIDLDEPDAAAACVGQFLDNDNATGARLLAG